MSVHVEVAPKTSGLSTTQQGLSSVSKALTDYASVNVLGPRIDGLQKKFQGWTRSRILSTSAASSGSSDSLFRENQSHKSGSSCSSSLMNACCSSDSNSANTSSKNGKSSKSSSSIPLRDRHRKRLNSSSLNSNCFPHLICTT